MVDNRASAVAQRKLQAAIDTSPRQVAQRQQAEAVAPRRNATGLPDDLKAGVENLSGYSLDDVRVHYNSDKPAKLQAHAYAQGSDIHMAPGQEEHLPHEAWHVVQQKQDKVRPTTQLKGTNINDDAGLEREADLMGAKALQRRATPAALRTVTSAAEAVQRVGEDTGKKKGEDYCNNVQKLLNNIEGLLAGFATDEIGGILDIINANRAKCSVGTELVTGADTNTKDYGDLNSSVIGHITSLSYLKDESSAKYFKEEVGRIFPLLRTLFNTLPTAAIDPRVATVIRSGTAGDAGAMTAINDALGKLRNALIARLKEYLTGLFNAKWPPKKDPGPDPGPGPGGGGQAITA